MTFSWPPERSASLAWTAVLLGGLLLASIAAPFVFAALGAVSWAAHWPYSRIFNRTAMVVAAVLLYVFRRPLGWHLLPQLYNSRSPGRAGMSVLAGFAAALAGTTLAVAAAFALGLLGPAPGGYAFFAARTATTLAGALVVAWIEETFFRGLMFPSLAATAGTCTAAIASSAAYSLVHLLVSDSTLVRSDFSLGAGFRYVVHAVGRQIKPASLLPLCGTFLCGLVLATAVRRSGTLFLAIGLHAGWAAAFQILRHATCPRVAIPGSSYLATHYYLVGTPWAWAGVLLSGLAAIAWHEHVERRGSGSPDDGESALSPSR